MKLLVATHVPHWVMGRRVMSSAYFVKDLRVFSDFFEEINICAPLSKEPPAEDVVSYGEGYSVTNCPVSCSRGLWPKLGRLIGAPRNIVRILKAMRRCDAVHIRCPGNIGLFGAIALLFSRRPRCAKYASQWTSFEGEPLSSKIQRYLLSRRGFGGPVTINATWQGNRGHIYSVFNSSVGREQLKSSAEIAKSKRLTSPVRFLFVGRITQNKNLDDILRSFTKTRGELDGEVMLDIVGDGPALDSVRELAENLDLGDSVAFHGRLDQRRLGDFYSKAHVLVLVSNTEGWPKTPMEAMCYGLPCICTNISTLPIILGDNERGLLVKPRDVEGLADAMRRLSTDEELYTRLSRAGRGWIETKTREDLMIQIKRILEEAWGMHLRELDWM